MTEQEFISFMGPLAQADMAKSGVLASVTTAQSILESGHGSTELARNANNFFGMKCSLSGNTWPGSTWDGVSKYRKQTGEEDANGNAYTITADFRKYALGNTKGNRQITGTAEHNQLHKIVIPGIDKGKDGQCTYTRFDHRICNRYKVCE